MKENLKALCESIDKIRNNPMLDRVISVEYQKYGSENPYKVHMGEKDFFEMFEGELIRVALWTGVHKFRYFKTIDGIEFFCLSGNK